MEIDAGFVGFVIDRQGFPVLHSVTISGEQFHHREMALIEKR
jgi:hypothetical protein